MTHRRYWVYFLLFLFNVICYLDRINMSVAGRSVATEFGLSPIQLGYLFSSFLWAYVLMMLPSGRAVDSLGAPRVAAIGAAFWSIAQMLSGAATGFGTMIIARLGLGAGEAPTFPVSYRGVRDWAPAGERGLAVGCIQAGTLFGPALSAPLVAWLIAATSWRVSFVITGAIGLVWVAVWLGLVSTPETDSLAAGAGAQAHPGRTARQRENGGPWRRRLPRPAAVAVDVGAGDLSRLRGVFCVSLPELVAELPANGARAVDRELRLVHLSAVPSGWGGDHSDELDRR